MRLFRFKQTCCSIGYAAILAGLALISVGCSSARAVQPQSAATMQTIHLAPARASSAALPGPLMTELAMYRQHEGQTVNSHWLNSRNDHLLSEAPALRRTASQHGVTVVDDLQWTVNGHPRNSIRIRQRSIRYQGW